MSLVAVVAATAVIDVAVATVVVVVGAAVIVMVAVVAMVATIVTVAVVLVVGLRTVETPIAAPRHYELVRPKNVAIESVARHHLCA